MSLQKIRLDFLPILISILFGFWSFYSLSQSQNPSPGFIGPPPPSAIPPSPSAPRPSSPGANTPPPSSLRNWLTGRPTQVNNSSNPTCDDPQDEPTGWWERRGLRTKLYLEERMRDDIQFFNVDLDDPESLDRLDAIDRETFHEFAGRRLARASEWYLVGLFDEEAEDAEDLLPDWIRDAFKVGDLGLRFGFSRSFPFERQVINLENQTRSMEAREQTSSWKQIFDNFPQAEARAGFLEDLIPGDFAILGRIRGQRLGWGLDWKPAPESLPLRLRYEQLTGIAGEDNFNRVSANFDILGLGRRDYCDPNKMEFYLSTNYDLESGDVFFGVNFSSIF